MRIYAYGDAGKYVCILYVYSRGNAEKLHCIMYCLFNLLIMNRWVCLGSGTLPEECWGGWSSVWWGQHRAGSGAAQIGSVVVQQVINVLYNCFYMCEHSSDTNACQQGMCCACLVWLIVGGFPLYVLVHIYVCIHTYMYMLAVHM